MPLSKLYALGLLASFLSPALLAAEEVEYIRENGRDYRVTRRVVTRPRSETRIEEHERVVYQEHLATEYEETSRIVHVPVTEYRWEAEWRGRWNPFQQPYLVQRLVPRTQWEARAETVRVPVTRRELVPVTKTVRVPVTERWLAQEEVIRKQELSPLSTEDSREIAVARRQSIGGVEKLSSDPPRGTDATRR